VSRLPQRSEWDAVNTEARSHIELQVALVARQRTASLGHPDRIGQLGLPVDGCPCLSNRAPITPRLLHEWLGTAEVIRHDIGNDNRDRGRPVRIHASTSPAWGRRAWRVQDPSISSSRAVRSPTCCSRTARTSCSMERLCRRARALRDLTTLAGTLRIVNVAVSMLLA
jgi:hypothetical protein